MAKSSYDFQFAHKHLKWLFRWVRWQRLAACQPAAAWLTPATSRDYLKPDAGSLLHFSPPEDPRVSVTARVAAGLQQPGKNARGASAAGVLGCMPSPPVPRRALGRGCMGTAVVLLWAAPGTELIVLDHVMLPLGLHARPKDTMTWSDLISPGPQQGTQEARPCRQMHCGSCNSGAAAGSVALRFQPEAQENLTFFDIKAAAQVEGPGCPACSSCPSLATERAPLPSQLSAAWVHNTRGARWPCVLALPSATV